MQFLRQKSADKVKYIVIAAVLALISSVAAAYYFQFFGVAVNSSLFLVLFVSTLRCEKDLKKTDLPGILVCWLFWFLTMQGALLSADELLSAKRLLLMAAGSIDFAVVLCRVLKAMDPLARHLLNGTEGRRPVDSHTLYWKVWLPSFVIMLLCWLPTLLAFYPGLFTNDVPDQAVETMGAYHTHHPLIHTLFLQACLHVGDLFGNANIGVVLYCVIQMSLLAAAMAAVLTFIYRKNGGSFIYSSFSSSFRCSRFSRS